MASPKWFVQHGENASGPLTSADLKAAVAAGTVRPETRIRREADTKWFPASQVQGLFDPAPAAPAKPTAPTNPTAPSRPPAPTAAGGASDVNPFVAGSGAPASAALAAGSSQPEQSAPAAVPVAAPAAAGGSALDVFKGSPALQFTGAAVAVGVVTFMVAMLIGSLLGGPDEPATVVAAADVVPEPTTAPVAPEPTEPAPAPATTSAAAAAASPSAETPATPTPPGESAAPAAPASQPAAPAPVEPIAPASDPADQEEMPAPAAGEQGKTESPAAPPEKEPSPNTPDGAPRVSLADLAVPEPATKQKESFDARIKRLGELHTLHKNALNEWRGLDERRGPLQTKAESMVPAIATTQRLLAEWQNELQICQGEYNGAVQRYNTTKDPGARSLAQSEGNQWQARANTAQIRLNQFSQQLARQQQTLVEAQKQLADVVGKQAKLIAGVDDTAPQWMQLCDPFGKLSTDERATVLKTFNQWIKEESQLAYSYLGRAFVHIGNSDAQAAQLDLAEAERLDPRLVLATKPIRGYALARGGDTKAGMALLNEVVRDAPKAWLPFLLRGRVYLETGEYGRAEGDLEKATRFGENVAEAHEALAYLLASCPQQSILSGKKALTAAAKACDLTKNQDWRCLDVLAAAHAESGDFETAEKRARAAIELAAPEFAPQLEERLKLYHQGQAYRFAAVEKRDR